MRALYAALPLVVACSAPSTVPASAPPIVEPQTSKVDLWLDGAPFHARSCKAGSSSGFLGFDLTGEDGTRVRIVSELDGASKVIVFRNGAERGITLVDCSRADMHEQRGKYSSSVHGRASMKCEAAGVRIEGTVLYDRC